jgi:hypothetical protein
MLLNLLIKVTQFENLSTLKQTNVCGEVCCAIKGNKDHARIHTPGTVKISLYLNIN